MNQDRVAVTGMGLVHALGPDPESFWQALVAGRTGLALLDDPAFARFPSRVAARISDFPVGEYLDSKEARTWDRFSRLGVYAALQAWKNAGLGPGPAGERTGVWIGSGMGGAETLLRAQESLSKGEWWRSSPYTVPMMITNIAAGLVSMKLGAGGPCIAPVTACATGNNAIGEAFLAIRDGRVDLAVAGEPRPRCSRLRFPGSIRCGPCRPGTTPPKRPARRLPPVGTAF